MPNSGSVKAKLGDVLGMILVGTLIFGGPAWIVGSIIWAVAHPSPPAAEAAVVIPDARPLIERLRDPAAGADAFFDRYANGVALIWSGAPRIVDGDTFALGPTRVRLWGVDAPEVDGECFPDAAGRKDCAALATAYLRSQFAFGRFGCKVVEIDRYQRPVATCGREEIGRKDEFATYGDELGLLLLNAGFAVFWPPTDAHDLPELELVRDSYPKIEADARAAHRGLWACDAPTPVPWAVTKRLVCP